MAVVEEIGLQMQIFGLGWAWGVVFAEAAVSLWMIPAAVCWCAGMILWGGYKIYA